MRFFHSSLCSAKGIEDETFTMCHKSISALTRSCHVWRSKGDGKDMEKQYSRARTPLCVIWWALRDVPPAGNTPNMTWEQRIQSQDEPAPLLLKQIIFVFCEVRLSYSWRVRGSLFSGWRILFALSVWIDKPYPEFSMGTAGAEWDARKRPRNHSNK